MTKLKIAKSYFDKVLEFCEFKVNFPNPCRSCTDFDNCARIKESCEKYDKWSEEYNELMNPVKPVIDYFDEMTKAYRYLIECEQCSSDSEKIKEAEEKICNFIETKIEIIEDQ